MASVYLALGSNVGEPLRFLAEALTGLAGFMTDVSQAPIYKSKAVGYTDQADFYNTAVFGTTTLAPLDLLKHLKQLEQSIGRVERFRWGPREIDIDIILYDDVQLKDPALTIPHPSFRERSFVLQPLLDLSPTLVDPVTKTPLSQLLAQITDQAPLIRVDV